MKVHRPDSCHWVKVFPVMGKPLPWISLMGTEILDCRDQDSPKPNHTSRDPSVSELNVDVLRH